MNEVEFRQSPKLKNQRISSELNRSSMTNMVLHTIFHLKINRISN
jgi:hypothetical protein